MKGVDATVGEKSSILRGGNKRANRQDVARLAGVSTAVVSYVINDGPRPVAAATKAKVLEAMHVLSYRPNATARALKLQRTNVIGLLVRDITNPYFSELASAIQDHAHRAGYAIMIGTSGQGGVEETAEFQNLLDRQVDGIAVYGIRRDETLAAIERSGARVVSLDWHLDRPGVPSVGIDDFGAAREAVEHLLQHGYNEVGLIAGRDSADLREQAWADAMGIRISPERLTELRVFGDYTLEGGYEAALALLRLPEPPRAIFVSSDVQAIGALRAAHSQGIRVPQDLALISIDGTDAGKFAFPSLSAIELPFAEIAEYIVGVLTSRSAPATGQVFEHLLVRGESCGCVPIP